MPCLQCLCNRAFLFSSEECSKCFFYFSYFGYLYAELFGIDALKIVFWYKDCVHAKLFSFHDALFHSCDLSYFT